MRPSPRISRIVCSNSFHKSLFFLTNSFKQTVRFSLKDLEKAYEKTEEDIKAVQSVGQIIGEVMKQLDDERCMYNEPRTCMQAAHTTCYPSHCESFIRSPICCLLPSSITSCQAQSWYTSIARYDNTDHHAHSPS
jgi:hypothetical protein